jgi:regulator of cell morphogenesis and NO signaling
LISITKKETAVSNTNFSEAHSDQTMADIVTKNFKTAGIFEKYDLDFCCGGNKTIAQACRENGTDPDLVFSEIEKIESEKVEIPERIDDWDLDFIVDYIVNNHHKFVRYMIPIVSSHADKVASAHEKNHPETLTVAKVFSTIYKDLKQHMMKEEEILFPYIKYLVKVRNGEVKFEKPYFGRIGNPINMMELEHQSAGESMHSIRKLTNNYATPSDACNTYKVCLNELREFEEDLHKHVHLENNILFPKAVLLEEQLISG